MDAFAEAAYKAFRALEMARTRTGRAMRKPQETAQAMDALARLADRIVDIHWDLKDQAAQFADDATQPDALRETSYSLSEHLNAGANHAHRFARHTGTASDLLQAIAGWRQPGTSQH